MRYVVSVATGRHYVTNQDRLRDSLNAMGQGSFTWTDMLPPGSPKHEDNPYSFKVVAIEDAVLHGATSILWCDSSVVVLKPLGSLWGLIESQGYWFSRNYGYTQGQFCNDEALAIMGVTREEAFKIPHVVASCFGLDMRKPIAQEFLKRWKAMAEAGAFKGDRGDLSGTGDTNRFIGHRNDQSCAAHVIHELGMTLTDPPDWFAEQGAPRNENTILTLER